jgi:hypothetical protein
LKQIFLIGAMCALATALAQQAPAVDPQVAIYRQLLDSANYQLAQSVAAAQSTIAQLQKELAAEKAKNAPAPASTVNAALQRVHFYPQDYGYTGASDPSNYINTCLNAAAAVSGVCFLPHVPGGTYHAVSMITVPQNTSLVCEDKTTSISPSVSMTSLIQITANSHSGVYNCFLNNVSGLATNGLDFNPVTFGNNLLYAEHVTSIGFVNNYHNTNADEFVIINSWSQNATGHAVRSIYAGTGSRIDGLQCVNDANGIYYSPGANTTEGVIIANSNCLTANTGTSIAIQFDESLFAQISNVDVTGQVFFNGNGTSNPQADADINGLFISANNSVGFLALGNIADFNLNGVTVSTASTCGMEFASDAFSVQRVAIRGFFGFQNTASGASDLCFNATAGGSITGTTVSDSWMTSSGRGVSSVVESGPAANLDISYLPHSTFLAATTTTRTTSSVFPTTANAIPYINANQGWGYMTGVTGSTCTAWTNGICTHL